MLNEEALEGQDPSENFLFDIKGNINRNLFLILTHRSISCAKKVDTFWNLDP